jgi:hypothetical protein
MSETRTKFESSSVDARPEMALSEWRVIQPKPASQSWTQGQACAAAQYRTRTTMLRILSAVLRTEVLRTRLTLLRSIADRILSIVLRMAAFAETPPAPPSGLSAFRTKVIRRSAFYVWRVTRPAEVLGWIEMAAHRWITSAGQTMQDVTIGQTSFCGTNQTR